MKTQRISILFLILMNIIQCSSNTEKSDSEIEQSRNELITLSEEQFDLANLELGYSDSVNFYDIVHANGIVDVPPENKARVSTFFGGTVKNLSLLPGQRVNEGQLLFSLVHPNFIQIQEEYLSAKSQLEYLRIESERQQKLADENIASKKQSLKASADYSVMLAKKNSLSKQLQLMNIKSEELNADNIQSEINIIAPISGFLTEVNISRGDFLNPSENAMTIIDTEHIHLELELFETDFSKVREGQKIIFKIQDQPDNEFIASVFLVNKVVENEHRTIQVHAHLDDEGISLTPGIYIEAKILSTPRKVLALPSTAVVEIDTRYFILERVKSNLADYVFRPVEIEIGTKNEDYIEIIDLNMLDLESEILLKGAFNLISD